MSKEKTAMQMIIEEIDTCISNLGSKNDLLTRHQKGRLVDAKSIAKRLLQKEQDQIERAFESGVTDVFDSAFDKDDVKGSGKTYYQSKYGYERI